MTRKRGNRDYPLTPHDTDHRSTPDAAMIERMRKTTCQPVCAIAPPHYECERCKQRASDLRALCDAVDPTLQPQHTEPDPTPADEEAAMNEPDIQYLERELIRSRERCDKLARERDELRRLLGNAVYCVKDWHRDATLALAKGGDK